VDDVLEIQWADVPDEAPVRRTTAPPRPRASSHPRRPAPASTSSSCS